MDLSHRLPTCWSCILFFKRSFVILSLMDLTCGSSGSLLAISELLLCLPPSEFKHGDGQEMKILRLCVTRL